MRYIIALSAGASVVAFGAVGVAKADEQMRSLAASGQWMAMAHQTSMVAAPDICFAGNIISKVFIRSDENGVEVRVLDESWSLPPNVQGTIDISVGNFSKNFKVTDNTDKNISASVLQEDLVPFFAAMDNASSMTVVIGKVKKLVSLAGSTKVTNAFRTCAGISGAPSDPSSNPFQ